MSSTLAHEGLVVAVTGDGAHATIRILPPPQGCDGCPAASLCGAPKEETISLPATGLDLHEGQLVKLQVSQSSHVMAVVSMLILPLVLSLAAYFLAAPHTGQGAAAGFSLGALAAYFGILALWRPSWLASRIRFRIIVK